MGSNSKCTVAVIARLHSNHLNSSSVTSITENAVLSINECHIWFAGKVHRKLFQCEGDTDIIMVFTDIIMFLQKCSYRLAEFQIPIVSS